MVKCPRCGFEQPRDRFCAKCGIVMDNFVTKPTGYGPLPYVLSLIVIVLSSGLYYRYVYSRHAKPEEVDTNPPPRIAAKPSARPVSTPLDQVKNLAAVTRPLIPAVTASVVNSEVSPVPTSTANERAEPSTAGVDFDLVSKDIMERMTQEGEGHLDIGSFSLSVVPRFKAKYDGVRGEEGFKQLSADSKTLTVAQPSMVFRGGKEPKRNEAIGLYVELTPMRMAERGMEFKISIKRSLPELTSTGDTKVTSLDFDDQTVVIPNGSGAVVAGILPRKPMLEGEDKLYETNILNALLDPAFQKGDSEFLVVITPQ